MSADRGETGHVERVWLTVADEYDAVIAISVFIKALQQTVRGGLDGIAEEVATLALRTQFPAPGQPIDSEANLLLQEIADQAADVRPLLESLFESVRSDLEAVALEVNRIAESVAEAKNAGVEAGAPTEEAPAAPRSIAVDRREEEAVLRESRAFS